MLLFLLSNLELVILSAAVKKQVYIIFFDTSYHIIVHV